MALVHAFKAPQVHPTVHQSTSVPTPELLQTASIKHTKQATSQLDARHRKGKRVFTSWSNGMRPHKPGIARA